MTASLLGRAGTHLDALRENRVRRRVATGGAIVVGLGAVWIHWIGFVLGGALVSLPQSSIRRGLLAGLGFGVFSWISFVAWLATAGNETLYFGMGQVLAISTVIALLGSLLGALVRGIR